MSRKHSEENLKPCEICGREYRHVSVVGDPSCNLALAVNEFECLWCNIEICGGCIWDNKNFIKPENWPKNKTSGSG